MSYEIWNGKKPNMKHLHEFGSPCYILNNKEPRGTFDAKSDEGFFLGYYTNNHAYRVYNKRTKAEMEPINVRVNDYLPPRDTSRLEDPPTISFHEEEKTLNSPKNAPPSSDKENDQVSTNVQTIPEVKHPVITDVRTTEDALQQ